MHSERARPVGLGIAVLAVVLLAAACSKTSPIAVPSTTAPATTTTSTTAPPAVAAKAPPPTQWDAVEAHIGKDGHLDLAGTRLAFSLLFRPLPGVTLPAGAATSDLRSDGSMVASAVLQHWTELSSADRTIMAPYFADDGTGSTGLAADPNGGATTTTAPAGSPPTTASKVHRSRSAPVRAQLASVVTKAPKAPPSQAAIQAVTDQVWAIVQGEEKLLKDPQLNSDVTEASVQVRFSSSDLVGDKGQPEDAAMWTIVVGPHLVLDTSGTKAAKPQSGPAKGCIIYLAPATWGALSTSGSTPAGDVEQLAHEVFHCLSGRIVGRDDVDLWDREPAWFVEGGAAWAGADYAHSNAGYDIWFQTWLQKQDTSLIDRDYDAIGFYATLQRLGALSWEKWDGLFEKMQSAGIYLSTDLFSELTKGVDGLAEAWAHAYARHPEWGADWEQTGQDIDHDRPNVRGITVSDGTKNDVVGLPYAVGELDVSANSPVIVTVTGVVDDSDGVIRLHDSDTLDEIAQPVARFCLGGGSCSCDKDAAGDPIGIDATGTVRIAVTGMTKGDGATVTAKANDKDCDVPKLPDDADGTATDPNSPGGDDCVGHCGASNGDPHLTTISGFHYDMQGIGEFVMLQSGATAKGAPFELQTRAVAHGPKPVHYTCNLVVAMSWDGPRITVTSDLSGTDAPIVRVDGTVVHLPTTVSGGVKLVEGLKDVVTATGPDGITVIVRPLPEYGEHLLVEVPNALVKSMHGLLATDHDGAVAARDGHLVSLETGGTIKGIHTRNEREYHDLVDSWRVTQGESLFDYGPGQSTKTFTDRSAPDLSVLEASPTDTEIRAAEKLCAAVSPEWLRAECAYDVASTGDDGLVTSYKALKPATGPSKTVGKVVHPGDFVPLHGYTGSVTYRLSITKTGYLDINFSVGCFGGFPGQVFDGHTVVVETITKNPLGTVSTFPEICDDQIGVPALKTGIYTITFVSKGVKDAKIGFTISKIRQIQFTH